MTGINALFLLTGLLLFISVLASTISARLGLPLLLLFLGVGMLAGEDGPGGIVFEDFFIASLIAQAALSVILLDGGLRTRVSSFRVALKPAAVLASWGVIGTALRPASPSRSGSNIRPVCQRGASPREVDPRAVA